MSDYKTFSGYNRETNGNLSPQEKDEINRRFLLAIQERMGIMLKALDNNVDNIIKNQAKIFAEREIKIWDKLGNAGEYNNITDFKNVTSDVKNNTGYVLMYGGVKIAGTILSKSHLSGTPKNNPISNIGGTYEHKPSWSFDGKNKMIKKFLNLEIFTTSEHSGYLDNPLKRVTEKGKLWQGTGWFQLYSMEIINLFYETFLNGNKTNNKGRKMLKSSIDIKNNRDLFMRAISKEDTYITFNFLKEEGGLVVPHRSTIGLSSDLIKSVKTDMAYFK